MLKLFINKEFATYGASMAISKQTFDVQKNVEGLEMTGY